MAGMGQSSAVDTGLVHAGSLAGEVVGYTPVFSDIYTGTLYGRWPAAAVWASLLPLMDKHGRIDMSLQAISGMTGWPMDLLEQGIKQLMEPDPDSRTPGEDGKRLVPIDTDRQWGWQAVNHAKYKEKARKMNHDVRRQETGENAARMRDRRGSNKPDVTRDDPTRPDATRSDPPSNTNTYTERVRDRSPGGDRFPEFWEVYPRKVGKEKARDAWRRKKLDAKADQIISHIQERADKDSQWLEGKQFIPHPTTWLNRGGWEDEYEVVAEKPAHDDGAYI